MPSFSQFSKDNLDTCHSDLQNLFHEVIKHFDCRIMEGHRSAKKQFALYQQGRTKPGDIVTNIDGINKKGSHNLTPSRAADVMPYPVDYTNVKRNAVFAGFVLATAIQMDIPIRWGGDWDGDTILTDQKFHDWPHWEVI